MAYKFKYIIIREKPYNKGQTMAQVNVSDLNKKGVNARLDELEKKFPSEKYVVCLTECNHEMKEFLNAPYQLEGKKIKSLFLTYFDGCHEYDAEPNTCNTFTMGVCKLEYKNNKLTVHLRRPGLLIGRGGKTIDALSEHLGCEIGIVEIDLYNEV